MYFENLALAISSPNFGYDDSEEGRIILEKDRDEYDEGFTYALRMTAENLDQPEFHLGQYFRMGYSDGMEYAAAKISNSKAKIQDYDRFFGYQEI